MTQATAAPTDKPGMRLAFIGTGIMGAAMCGHLISAGYAPVVYTRRKEKAKDLLERGAAWAASPAEAASGSDVIFTMVGFPKDVREVYFGANGVLAGARPGSILVDMTTTSPSLAVEIYQAAAAKGVKSLDAPVSGGDVGARSATLTIMCGGDPDTYEAVKPLLEIMGKTIVLQGAAGAGQHTKMCNQIVIAGHMIGVCESLLYAVRAGLDPATVLTSISTGAAACPALNNLWPRILKDDFDPGFFIDHFVKDMGIALEEARRMGLELKGLELVEGLYKKAQEQGLGQRGTQALYLALRALAGLDG